MRIKLGMTVGAAAAMVALVSMYSESQTTTTYRAPRAPGNRPDFNGIWQVLNTANYDIEAHVARPAMALRPGPFGPVPAAPVLALGAVGAVPGGMGVVEGGELPYRPEALAQRKENQENWVTRDPEIKCYLPGVPRATYMPYPFQIIQSASAIFIAYEYAGATRNIYMKDPGPPPADSWMGQSVGKWEGDTLVVDVKGFNESFWFSNGGLPHTDALHLIERYSRPDLNTLRYEVTIDDPGAYTRTWTSAWEMKWMAGEELPVYYCQDNRP